MSIEERNAAWDGSRREFRQLQTRGKNLQTWIIEVRGAVVTTIYGKMGGKLQTVSETLQPLNVGKSNAKSAAAVAMDRALRQILLKTREGYREIGSHGDVIDEVTEAKIDFESPPPELRFYKPESNPPKSLMKKMVDKKVLYTRKRDGFMHLIVKGSGKARIFARTMARKHAKEMKLPFTFDDRFIHIVSQADEIMPPNSMMLGEIVMDRNGSDDMKHVQSVLKSLTPESLLLQETQGWCSYYVWDIAFWDGQDMVSKLPVRARYDLIHELEYEKNEVTGTFPLIPVEIFNSNHAPWDHPDAALEYAQLKKWEGYVVVDPEGVYGDDAYNFRGKTDRPGEFCAKWKPEGEDDFIAIWDPAKGIGEVSTKDKYKGGPESVQLYQLNSKGEMVPISLVSSGMTNEMKQTLREWDFPQVWKVGFDERYYLNEGQGSNSLRHPRYLDRRTDKTIEECINPNLDPKEE